MATLTKGTMFNEVLVTELINLVQGKSSLAALSKQTPIPFNGSKEFTFTMDQDVDIVAENGKKTAGGVTMSPIIIQPVKVEYGARLSDEFRYGSEEAKLDMLRSFAEGFARKVSRALDLMAFHGINPRTKAAAATIGGNHFDAKVTQTVAYNAGKVEENVEAAVAMVQGAGGEVSGIAMSPLFSQALAQLKVNGVRQYPELAWGANPGTINGLACDVNPTVAEGGTENDKAIIGDFENMFKWGYAKTIPMEIIEYGDPDNSGHDLKGYNQIYVRAEAYIGWAILNPAAFARIKG